MLHVRKVVAAHGLPGFLLALPHWLGLWRDIRRPLAVYIAASLFLSRSLQPMFFTTGPLMAILPSSPEIFRLALSQHTPSFQRLSVRSSLAWSPGSCPFTLRSMRLRFLTDGVRLISGLTTSSCFPRCKYCAPLHLSFITSRFSTTVHHCNTTVFVPLWTLTCRYSIGHHSDSGASVL